MHKLILTLALVAACDQPVRTRGQAQLDAAQLVKQDMRCDGDARTDANGKAVGGFTCTSQGTMLVGCPANMDRPCFVIDTGTMASPERNP